MIFVFTYLPFNLWIKFPSTVVLTFLRCIRNSPEDLLKHSCWPLTESFTFSRLSGIWWSAFLTSSLVILTLLVQGPHVKNRCSRERRIRSPWDCELGSPGRTRYSYFIFPLPGPSGQRSEALSKIQQGTCSRSRGGPYLGKRQIPGDEGPPI